MKLAALARLCNVDPDVLKQLERAEAVAAQLIARHGLLLDHDAEVSLHEAIEQRQLPRKDRLESAAARKALSTVDVNFQGQTDDGGSIACGAYTPLIDAGYFLGLAMGFAAAQKLGIGGVR